MIFLTNEDLKAAMFQRFINESSGDDESILDNIELQNIGLFKSKLNARYDVGRIFEVTGTERNHLIVKYLAILVLSDMIRRNSARKVPSDLEELKKEAMGWLNDVRDGKEHPFELPEISEEGTDDNSADVLYGNNYNSDFYL